MDRFRCKNQKYKIDVKHLETGVSQAKNNSR